jgi:sensor histidine kinase YesM
MSAIFDTLFSSFEDNFFGIFQGIFIFQMLYIAVQYLLTKRKEYFYYLLYLISSFFICSRLENLDNFYELFIDEVYLSAAIFSFSMICYWLFSKNLFNIEKANRIPFITIKISIFTFSLIIILDILFTFFFIDLHEKAVLYMFKLTYVPTCLIFVLYYHLFKTNDKILAAIITIGAFSGDLFSAFIQFALSDDGLFTDQNVYQNGYFWFIVGYEVDTIFISLALAYKTQQIYNKNLTLETKLLESQLTSLRSQMNPHFIHNALNAINRFILNNENETANIYLTKFSRLMRQILNNSRQEYITLKNEINTLTKYIELESLRFNKQFTYSIHIGKSVNQDTILIPSLILQPLVENAIYHGLLNKKGEKKLSLSFDAKDNGLEIKVFDNGIGFTASKKIKGSSHNPESSFGLKMIEERIETLNKTGKQRIEFKCVDSEEGVEILINIF